MAVVKIRPTPRSAFNPRRPASTLLLAQLAHLEHVVGAPTPTRSRVLTEGEAARRIGELTARLLGQAPGAAPARGLLPRRGRPRPTKKAATTTRTAASRRRR